MGDILAMNYGVTNAHIHKSSRKTDDNSYYSHQAEIPRR